jgi:SAM-dependent methyltransferase
MAENSTDLVKSQFGVAAADYATAHVFVKGEGLARIVELTQPQPDWRVLDVATGAGHLAAAFAPHVASVVASDITDEMLAEAAKLAASRNLTNMTTATAKADALPFPNESFDLVCCRFAAHHFPSLDAFVGEVARVLKPHGRFALSDNVAPDRQQLPDASDTELRDAAEAYNAFEKLRDPSHGRAPPPDEWVDLVAKHGLQVAAREQFDIDLEFATWTARMRCTPDVVSRLEGLMTDGPPALRQFLRPNRDANGTLHFKLQELLLVADKAG